MAGAASPWPAFAKIDKYAGLGRRWLEPQFGKLSRVVGKVRKAAALGGRQRVEVVRPERVEKRGDVGG